MNEDYISWRIFNTNVSGKIKRFNDIKYKNILEHVRIRTGYTDISDIASCGRIKPINSQIEDRIKDVMLTSESVQSRVAFGNDLGRQTIPDAKKYDLAIIQFIIFRYNQNVRHDERVKITSIVKIIKNTDDHYIIKFPKPYQINIFGGPTVASLYALLSKSPKRIYPIYTWSVDFELLITKCCSYKNQYSALNYKWWSINKDTCLICMDNIKNCFAYCSESHLITCEECIEILNKCPICREPIVAYDKVKFI